MSINVVTVANTLSFQVRPRGTELSSLPVNYPAIPAIKFYTDSRVMQHAVDRLKIPVHNGTFETRINDESNFKKLQFIVPGKENTSYVRAATRESKEVLVSKYNKIITSESYPITDVTATILTLEVGNASTGTAQTNSSTISGYTTNTLGNSPSFSFLLGSLLNQKVDTSIQNKNTVSRQVSTSFYTYADKTASPFEGYFYMGKSPTIKTVKASSAYIPLFINSASVKLNINTIAPSVGVFHENNKTIFKTITDENNPTLQGSVYYIAGGEGGEGGEGVVSGPTQYWS